MTGARSVDLLEMIREHPEVIAQVEQGLPYDKHGKRRPKDMDALRAAAEGDPAELFGLSERYERGNGGVQQNRELAAKLRFLAAEAGQKEAQFKFGEMCEWKDLVPQDGAAAAEFYRRAAEQGHVGAMFALGRLFYRGVLVSQDLVEAEKWLRRAAAYGKDRAQFMLGHMYANGMGVGLSQEDAREWMRSRIIKMGYTPSPQLFDRSSNSPAPVESSGEAEADEPPDAADEDAPSSPANVRSEEEKDLAVQEALERAMLRLIRPLPLEERMKEDGKNDPNAARRCMETLGEVEKLLAPELAEWEAKKAKLRVKMGMPEAETPPKILQEHETAGMRFGRLNAALRWVTPAADDAVPKTVADKLAAIKAAIMPERNRQLKELQAESEVDKDKRDAQMEKNRTEAERWLIRAANQGHAESQFYLGHLYYNGICVRKDRSAASEWWRCAADQGHPNAQYKLGLMYGPSPKIDPPPNGDGANAKMWRTWLRDAAEQGHFGAQIALRMWYAESPDTNEPNWEEAYLWCYLVMETNGETADETGVDRRELYLDQISERRQHAVIRKAEELHKKMLRAREKWQNEHDVLWGFGGNSTWKWWNPPSRSPEELPALPAPPPSE